MCVNEPDVIQLDVDPVRFGQSFVHSDAFKALFQEGMELVEETAAYLDGAGREESRHLSRQASLAYASESMRLTTRLMQIASWLLCSAPWPRARSRPTRPRPRRTACGSMRPTAPRRLPNTRRFRSACASSWASRPGSTPASCISNG